jgi:thiol-disulfide isomerase/thioredoxin
MYMRWILVTMIVGLIGNGYAQQKPILKTKSTSVQTAGKLAYQINIQLQPVKNAKIYLANYYGKYQQLADSCFLDANGNGVFKGKKKLAQGIYFVVSPAFTHLFDVLIDEKQQFSIAADTTKPGSHTVTGSIDNDLYMGYNRFLNQIAPQLNTLQQQYANAKNAADSAKLREALIAKNNELNAYRENIIAQHPTRMLSRFFNAMKRPEAPAYPPAVNGVVDSLYPARYIKAHFWDEVDFTDEALVRTPFFEPKLEDYYKYYVFAEADSIIPEVKEMLLSSRSCQEMYRYLLAKFTNKYINPEVMGQDKVFIYLFENYYLKGDIDWLSEKDKKTILNRGYSLIANQIGIQAPILDLITAEGISKPLYEQKSAFSFVVFWDPNCGHCKETIPRIDSFYKAAWKAAGLSIYAVNTEPKAKDAWEQFIKTHGLQDWTHVYETLETKQALEKAGQANYRQLYDVYQTPTLYLLDSEKRIIAKKLTLEQFHEILKGKLQKAKG